MENIRLECLKLVMAVSHESITFSEVCDRAQHLTDWVNEVQNIKLSIPIDTLALPARPINCLKAEGIKTIGDLITWSAADLLRTPNLGKKSLREIAEVLKAEGLHLNSENNQHNQTPWERQRADALVKFKQDKLFNQPENIR